MPRGASFGAFPYIHEFLLLCKRGRFFPLSPRRSKATVLSLGSFPEGEQMLSWQRHGVALTICKLGNAPLFGAFQGSRADAKQMRGKRSSAVSTARDGGALSEACPRRRDGRVVMHGGGAVRMARPAAQDLIVSDSFSFRSRFGAFRRVLPLLLGRAALDEDEDDGIQQPGAEIEEVAVDGAR